jgi:hypothetical protein
MLWDYLNDDKRNKSISNKIRRMMSRITIIGPKDKKKEYPNTKEINTNR